MRRSLNRGGNYNSGNQNGFASFNLNNPRSNSNVNIGFRSALLPFGLSYRLLLCQMLQVYGSASSTMEAKGTVPSIRDLSPGRKKPVSEPAVGHGSRHAPAQI